VRGAKSTGGESADEQNGSKGGPQGGRPSRRGTTSSARPAKIMFVEKTSREKEKDLSKKKPRGEEDDSEAGW